MRDNVKNSLLWFCAHKRYEPICSSVVYHLLVPAFNSETLSGSAEMLLKVSTLQQVMQNATLLPKKSEIRSREAEKPQYQHTQQKCFPQFAAPRFSSGHIRRIKWECSFNLGSVIEGVQNC